MDVNVPYKWVDIKESNYWADGNLRKGGIESFFFLHGKAEVLWQKHYESIPQLSIGRVNNMLPRYNLK